MSVMGGRGVVWLLFPPFAAAGWLGAHAVAYRLVAPDDHHRNELLAESGHGYLGAAPLVLACAVTLVVAGLAMAIHDGFHGRRHTRIPIWPLALVPLLGFAVQEHVERLIELGAFPTGAALEPTFLVGMALQLPIAALACLAARAMLVFGRAVGRRVAAPAVLRLRARNVDVQLFPREPAVSRGSILAGGHGQRAPPSLMTA